MFAENKNKILAIFHIPMLKKHSGFPFMNLLLVLGIIGVLPFIASSFFVNPVSDDFMYANTSLSQGAWQAQINWYQGWTGRYFATFVLTHSPLVYRWLSGYKLIPLTILVFLFFSIWVLFKSIAGRQFKNKTILTFSIVILFIYLHRFPSPTWGLFWMTGAVTYQLANIFTLFLLSSLIWILRRRNISQSIVFTIVASMSIFVVVGCNEISMLLVNTLLLTVAVVDYSIHKKVNFYMLWLIFFALGLTVFVFLSPGKVAREIDWGQSHQFIPSVIATLRRTVSQILFRLICSPLLIISIIALPLFNRISNYWIKKKTPLFNVNPLVALAWLFFLPALFFPLHYSLGPYEPNAERITNILFLFFIFNWLYFELLLLSYLKRQRLILLKKLKIPVIVWMLLLMFYGFFPFREHNRIRVAYKDLLSGESYMHNQLMEERIKYMQESDCVDCMVSAIPYSPETIVYRWFYINGNKNFWMNQQAAKYFGKRSMTVATKTKNSN